MSKSIASAQTTQAMAEFQQIPGVGPRMAQDLADLGYRGLNDLKHQDPEQMYQQLIALRGQHIDRCVLYVFRCCVYFVSQSEHDPELLKWWNWKDS